MPLQRKPCDDAGRHLFSLFDDKLFTFMLCVIKSELLKHRLIFFVQVDIGGGTLIDKSVLEQLSRACDSGSGPGKFARALLRHVFTDAELRGKSLFGGKGCHRGEAVQKEALDTVRVEAVIGVYIIVLQSFSLK